MIREKTPMQLRSGDGAEGKQPKNKGKLLEKTDFLEEDLARFWSLMPVGNPNECWIWPLKQGMNGYGRFTFRRSDNPRQATAHRACFAIVNGSIEGHLFVGHTCDNKMCVNPSHLFACLPKENTQDMVRKGRNKRGEESPTSKLKLDQVVQILELLAQGVSQEKIGRMFGIAQTSVSAINLGQNWKVADPYRKLLNGTF